MKSEKAPTETIRLDRFLSECGRGTRKEVKELLRRGMVLVDGETEKKPERKIDPDRQVIVCEGEQLLWEPFEYLMLHKPQGYLTAVSDRHARTVMDLIGPGHKTDLSPCGRLDVDTEGLLLLTNDGALIHRLISPAGHVDKTYEAVIGGSVGDAEKERFLLGLDIGEKRPLMPADLQVLSPDDPVVTERTAFFFRSFSLSEGEGSCSVIRLTIREGKYHQVKRMFEACGKKVLYLKRISMGPIVLDEKLKPGDSRPLTAEEIRLLTALKQTI